MTMHTDLNISSHSSGLVSLPETERLNAASSHALANYQIIRRNGAVVPFEPNKIAVALMKAFLAVHGTQGAASASVREVVEELTQNVVRALVRSRPGGGTFHIEDVQDQVELGLMRSSNHEVARAYVLYRERRTQERAQAKEEKAAVSAHPTLHVLDGGQRVPLDINYLQGLIVNACQGLGKDVQPDPIVSETMRNLYDGVPMEEVYKASILASRTLIEKDPDYTYATARLLLSIKTGSNTPVEAPIHEIMEFIESRPSLSDAVNGCHGLRHVIPSSAGPAWYYMAFRADPVMAVSALDTLITGVPKYAGDPIHAFRERMISLNAEERVHKNRQLKTIWTLTAAWNHYVKGKTLMKCPIRNEPEAMTGLDLALL